MSFFFETIALPFWFIIFILGSASPLLFKWYKKFKRVRSDAEMKADIFKKATDNRNGNSGFSGFSKNKSKKRKGIKKSVDSVKKHNIKSVLKVLAEGGEKGILPQSISDKTDISSIETKNALMYLREKKYAEEINSTNGVKYYLTKLGRKYCISKKYIDR